MLLLIFYGIISGMIRSLRSYFLTYIENIDTDILFMTQLLSSLILIPYIYLTNNNSIYSTTKYIFKNLNKYYHFILAQFSFFVGSYFYYKMYFFKIDNKKKDNFDYNFISVISAYSFPLIIAGILYNILNIEKYSLISYIYVFLIIIGNIGVFKYWN